MSNLRSLPIEDIRRRSDARPLGDAALAGLAESIDSIGLINPIRVRQVNGGYEVVAGAHRFAACDSLGHREIACFVVDDDDLHAELAMIDENLCRAELSPADRAKQTARRKVIYLELHPDTGHGANLVGGSAGVAKFATREIERFTAATAKVTGQSERLVQLNAERGQKIVPEALDQVSGTRLDHGNYLDRLKRIEPDQQVATVRRDLEQPRHGGIVVQYARAEIVAPPDNSKLFARFIEIADEIEGMSTVDLINDAGRQRAVLGQRASGIADRMGAIMEGLDQ